MSASATYWVIVAVIATPPVVLLLRAWHKTWTVPERSLSTWIPLLIATATCLCALAELFMPDAWGNRSTRQNVIGINMAISFGSLIAAARSRSQASAALACALMALICLWTYAAWVNSVA